MNHEKILPKELKAKLGKYKDFKEIPNNLYEELNPNKIQKIKENIQEWENKQRKLGKLADKKILEQQRLKERQKFNYRKSKKERQQTRRSNRNQKYQSFGGKKRKSRKTNKIRKRKSKSKSKSKRRHKLHKRKSKKLKS